MNEIIRIDVIIYFYVSWKRVKMYLYVGFWKLRKGNGYMTQDIQEIEQDSSQAYYLNDY